MKTCLALFLTALLLLCLGNGVAGKDTPAQKKLERAKALNNEAMDLGKRGDFAAATVPAEKALALALEAEGEKSPVTAFLLENLAFIYQGIGQPDKAIGCWTRSLAIHDALLEPYSPENDRTLDQLGTLLDRAGRSAEASKLFVRLIALRERTAGPDEPTTLDALTMYAETLIARGDLKRAGDICRRVERSLQEHPGPDESRLATNAHQLGVIAYHAQDWVKAREHLERALELRKKIYGERDLHTLVVRSSLAALRATQGENAAAQAELGRVIEDAIDVPRAEKLVGATLSSLASLARDDPSPGSRARAVALFQRAIDAFRRSQEQDAGEFGVLLTSFATLCYEIGDYAQAQTLTEEAVEKTARAYGEDHPKTGALLQLLMTVHFQRATVEKRPGEMEQAAKLGEKSLELFKKVEKPPRERVAIALDNLAAVMIVTGDFVRATDLQERALDLFEKIDPESMDTARCLENLGSNYLHQNRPQEAIASLEKAVALQEKRYGRELPADSSMLRVLMDAKWLAGDRDEVRTLAARWQASHEKKLGDLLTFASERQRLAFEHNDPGSLDFFARLGDAAPAATTVLREKGIVLDSLLEDRRASADGKPDGGTRRQKLDQLQAAKRELFRFLSETPPDLTGDIRQQRTRLEAASRQRIEQMESELARAASAPGRVRQSLQTTPAAVQTSLPAKSALVEFFVYTEADRVNASTPSYGAVVLPAQGEVRWVALGDAASLDERLVRYQRQVRGEEDEDSLRANLQALYTRIWAPVAKALPDGTDYVILCPDGQMNFLAFAALVAPDDRFLGEAYDVRYVASGRDLLRTTYPSAETTLQVFASPRFDASGKSAPPTTPPVALPEVALAKRDLERLRFDPLPGTREEARLLQDEAKQLHWTSEVAVDNEATEDRLARVHHPRILHIATHGFFLPDTMLARPAGTANLPRVRGDADTVLPEALLNPMYRSGLALSGAQNTLDAWKRGEVPAPERDGILTAEEAGGLDLDGTWLVVLSACNTGGGAVRAGEGVMGLRRGFLQAGTQNLLMTLWPIADAETAAFMRDFYTSAIQSGNAPRALAQVQREWLVRLRKEKGLASAVNIAAPFVLTFQGAAAR